MTRTIPRFDSLQAAKWVFADANGAVTRGTDLETLYGANVFGLVEMKARLPKPVYRALLATIEEGRPIDLTIADAVAVAMKEWALERGATHFTHWFQPLTGLTAEKHDSFLNPTSGGKAVAEFSGGELVQGEPDASSFPSGGLRATFEARGYTAWDPTSPAFIVEGPGGAVLAIPTAYTSWTGDALDQKIPLLRSVAALDVQARRALELFGVKATRVQATMGPEQEFFLIDQEFFYRRPDLITSNRTLFGAKPPRGQELEDHYFGTIPGRVLQFMQDAEEQLYKLGVPVKTRHNEVAPSQFEMAFVYAEANLAADYQQLMMSVLRTTARKYGFVCLLHEKPFAGVNGSGKHLNWSFASESANLLEPGETPHENLQFMFFCSAVLKAVEKHQDLLRASIAFAGNDHRLGANEAPPSIISVFLGDQLTDIYEQIERGGSANSSRKGGLLGLGSAVLPDLPQHAGDRNRTSPFAFTGNKFEFRALGSSQSVSFPATVLNTIVSEALDDMVTELEGEVANGVAIEEAMRTLLAREVPRFKRIIFNGDGYSDEWREEAESRGLLNLRSTMDALPLLTEPKNVQLFEKYHVLSHRELESRKEIALDQYFKTINIEGETTADIARTMIFPAAVRYLRELLEVAERADELDLKVTGVSSVLTEVRDLLNELQETTATLVAQNAELGGDEIEAKAEHMKADIIPAMDAVRQVADRLEKIVPDDLWPLPTYRDMLFVK